MLALARVQGHSMAPTLRPGDLLLTVRPGARGPRRGAVVVLDHDGTPMVKRIVGVPGSVVTLEAGRLAVDGHPVDGRPRVPGAYVRRWVVPAAHVFVAGDDPASSHDSRVWPEPFVPVSDVRGVVVARLGRRGRVPSAAAGAGEGDRRAARSATLVR